MNNPEKTQNLTFEETLKFFRQEKKITRRDTYWNRRGFDRSESALFLDGADFIANDCMVIENG